MMRIGFLHSLIRPDDKLLLQELQARPGVTAVPIDLRNLIAAPDGCLGLDVDVALNRCLSLQLSLAAVKVIETHGIECFSSFQVTSTCGSKLATSCALAEHEIPQPQVRFAFSPASAINAIESLGYPVVVKPDLGSWGRLLAKINDRDAAEAVLEHKTVLGSLQHSVIYIQQFIEKRDRDIRAFVIGDECVAAIYRKSEHWITNTARGAEVSACAVNDELASIAIGAARAVGGGALAVDLFETDDGYLVNEVNHSMEFKNSIGPTGVNIPAAVVDFVIGQARRIAA